MSPRHRLHLLLFLRALHGSTFGMGDWASRLPQASEALPGRTQRMTVPELEDSTPQCDSASPKPAGLADLLPGFSGGFSWNSPFLGLMFSMAWKDRSQANMMLSK
ncbi:hypothetical protein DUI87_05625 [Hirundo rustica rustica]|uniref:Uncharacterized protein n=1 Tax=Hirundo rustica rustica TaxID=333673 RepID=A0A3M0KUS7_HIRRU|nr:hypothetical protein DUI87_05625 [Hirundo rustica rustica]